MAISAGMVKALREQTGLPMMECKKALEESGGDEKQAIEILRKKGLAQQSKRAERTTSEGRLVFYTDAASGRTAIAEVLCETEPVSGNEDFRKLADSVGQAAAKLAEPSVAAVLEQPHAFDPSMKINDFLLDVVNRIRENIQVGRLACATGHVGTYLHHDHKKGVLVEFSGPCPDALKSDVCMHIVAMRPPYVRREDVPAEDVAHERAIAAEQVKGKPDNIVDKIVTGKLNKWYADICLLEQPFVKDDKKAVGQVLREVAPDLTIHRVYRFEIGEG